MNLPRIIDLIESVKDSKVLFMGETITDEYHFVNAIGKPAKEAVLAVRLNNAEIYEGGVLAARRHAETFCKTGQLTVGNKIRKIRYVEKNYTRKLFEVQEIQDGKCKTLIPKEMLSQHDMVAVTDYGHGMFGEEIVNQLCTSDKYLAIAVQTNAANLGFNLVTKYPRADYIVIDEPEARWAAHDRDSPIEDILLKLAHKRTKRMIITLGKNGSIGWDEDTGIHKVPAFTDGIVDTMGSGDAFFSVTAPMSKDGMMEDLLVIGNAAGKLKASVVGHRESVTKEKLIGYLKKYGTH